MKNIIITAVSLLALAACNNDEETTNTNPLDYPAEIHGTVREYSQTTIESKTGKNSWENGATIGVTTAAGISDLSYVVTDDRNVKYVYSADNDMFQVENITGEDYNIYFKGPYTMSMTAYAPYTGERGILPGIIEASTTGDKQTATQRTAIDFLFAEGGGSQKNTRVDFSFSHRMGQIVFSFNTSGGIEKNDLSYTLSNVILDGTFDTSNGTITTGNTIGDIAMSVSQDESMSSSLILFPQKMTSSTILIVSMGGKTYAKAIDHEFEINSGNSYLLNVTISPQAMTVSPAQITDWTLENNNSHYVIANNNNE